MSHDSPADTRFVPTRYGRVAYTDSDPGAARPGTPLLLIHGGSVSRRIFDAQFADDFGPRRLLAPDLLGHGDSDDASDPEHAYTPRGFAGTVLEFLDALGVGRVVVVGWSLGGYVGLQLAQDSQVVTGLVTTGTPPVGADDFARAFLPNPAFAHASLDHLTAEQAEQFAAMISTTPPPPAVVENVLRTGGRTRQIMFSPESVVGKGADWRSLVTDPPVPLAIVDGRDDPTLDREYVDAIPFTSLWRSAPVLVDGTGHAPFLEKPADYDELIREFLRDNDL